MKDHMETAYASQGMGHGPDAWLNDAGGRVAAYAGAPRALADRGYTQSAAVAGAGDSSDSSTLRPSGHSRAPAANYEISSRAALSSIDGNNGRTKTSITTFASSLVKGAHD